MILYFDGMDHLISILVISENTQTDLFVTNLLIFDFVSHFEYIVVYCPPRGLYAKTRAD